MAYKTFLTPPLLKCLYQAGNVSGYVYRYIYDKGACIFFYYIDFACFYDLFFLGFETVPTVWYSFMFSISLPSKYLN